VVPPVLVSNGVVGELAANRNGKFQLAEPIKKSSNGLSGIRFTEGLDIDRERLHKQLVKPEQNLRLGIACGPALFVFLPIAF
jgi:hypothetical protein